MSESVPYGFSPYFQIKYLGGELESVEIPFVSTEVEKIPLQKFKINEKKTKVDDRYSFIDTEKLLKLNNKKYTVKELREIAVRIDVDPNNKKLELARLIKLKIGL